MTDKQLIIQKDIQDFAAQNDYGNAARALLKQQKSGWPQLREGYESYKKIKTKSFFLKGYEIRIQFNPGRIESSSAKVDPQSIKERKCFLCPENLPEEQKGIAYKEEFIILANPFPIFPEHFTIASLKHVPQKIRENFRTMLFLGRDLSKYYTVFYNGPKCGASAPDHLHFQACTKSVMPLESYLNSLIKNCSELLLENPEESVYSVDDGIRKFFILSSKQIPLLEIKFNYIYNIFQDVCRTQEEPMMNLLLNYNEGNWRLIIFLREKHRPSLFGKGILWSPAAVDLGGLCIFPLEKDFNVISGTDLGEGFKEVIISNEIFDYIKKKLKEKII